LLMDFILQDPIRWNPLTDVVDGYSPTLPHLKGLQNGDTATSAIKQVDQHNSFIFSVLLYALLYWFYMPFPFILLWILLCFVCK
jgi:hypothetical protein